MKIITTSRIAAAIMAVLALPVLSSGAQAQSRNNNWQYQPNSQPNWQTPRGTAVVKNHGGDNYNRPHSYNQGGYTQAPYTAGYAYPPAYPATYPPAYPSVAQCAPPLAQYSPVVPYYGQPVAQCVPPVVQYGPVAPGCGQVVQRPFDFACNAEVAAALGRQQGWRTSIAYDPVRHVYILSEF